MTAFSSADPGRPIVDSEDATAGDITRRERQRYIDRIRRLIEDAQAKGEYTTPAGVSSGTNAESIEGWVQATKLRPGKARSRHCYVNDAARFFAAQSG